MMTTDPSHGVATLVLADGRVFRGLGFGAKTRVVGEVVFNTAMTGYQEILTDPSYTGQIVCLTTAEVGNVGVNPDDEESDGFGCAGLVVRSLAPAPSNWRSRGDLSSYLAARGVPGVCELDTRALTRHVREAGAIMAALATDGTPDAELLALARNAPSMAGLDLTRAASVTRTKPWTTALWDTKATPTQHLSNACHIVCWDFGVKHNLLRCLVTAGARVTVVPATTTAAEIVAMAPDGVLLSNGPGDPAAATGVIAQVRALLAEFTGPVFGVCLGHQLLALALGGRTYKLKFGHHGGNHPVRHEVSGQVAITSQNHGFAVDMPTLAKAAPAAALTHVNLFDGTTAGLRLRDRPVASVQYHPEAAPGPNDARPLLSGFVEQVRRHASAGRR